MRCLGSGAPPEISQRTRLRLTVWNSGASARSFQIVGTPSTTVHPSSSITRQTSAASKAACSTSRPPTSSSGARNAPSPPAWYSGVKIELQSFSPSCQQAAVL